MFELFIFHTTDEFDERALAAGVHGVVVDLEYRAKAERQQGFSTQINRHFPEDVERLKKLTGAYILCRLNAWNEQSPVEIERVLDSGADELLLPMVRTVEEIERAQDVVNGRAAFSIMLETIDAEALLPRLPALNPRRYYIGLTDLWIERATPHIFAALQDGTVERFCRALEPGTVGFAGLTLPEAGRPMACRHLINEMARLDSGFGFLRRSFLRDIEGRDLDVEIPRILDAVEQAKCRTVECIDADRLDCERALHDLPPSPWTL